MADTLVDSAIDPNLGTYVGLWGPYWSNVSIGAVVYVGTGGDLTYARTINKGEDWDVTEIQAGATRQVAVWWDKETPGNTGTLAHIAWADFQSDSVLYRTLDVAADSLGTERTVDNTVTIDVDGSDNRIAITLTRGDNIILAFSTQSEIECYKSDATQSGGAFATAGTDIDDVFETATEEDWCLLFPANTDDDNDACAIFQDRSANAITVKMYDDSADAWGAETSVGGIVDDPIYMNMDASVRHSDGHILVAHHNASDIFGNDIQTSDITVDDVTAPSRAFKTNVVTNFTEMAQVSVWINQQTDPPQVRVGYLKGGTWEVDARSKYQISDDGMASWDGEVAYDEATSPNQDMRLIHAGRTVGDAGGRYQPAVYEDNDTQIVVNENNDTEIAAVAGGLLPPSVQINRAVERASLF